MTPTTDDAELLEVFFIPLRKCAEYKPAFGQSGDDGVSLEQFRTLYGADLFYSWLGLDNDAVYAAHKAAGGLTSVYRQLGIGCERLFREILVRSLSLTHDQMHWEYEYEKPNGKMGVHTLDARMEATDLKPGPAARLDEWTKQSLAAMGRTALRTKGAVFEVRQGYKSADSKRQNADLRFGMRSYQEHLMPTFALMSNQISDPVMRRYRQDGMLVLTGTSSSDPTVSTFAFFKEVVGYDLAGLLQRNSSRLAAEVDAVATKLLSPE